MKKIIILLSLVICAISPLSAQETAPSNQILSAVQRQVQNSFSADKNIANTKLDREQDPEQWVDMDWEEFEKLNEEAKAQEVAAMELMKQEAQLIAENLAAPILFKFHNSHPDYANLLGEHKMIYIAESLNHETKAAPAEVIKILQALRHKNPDAKILLASEFLVWDLSQENADETPLLKKAGAKTVFDSLYPELTAAADPLRIDQLALDDIFIHYDEEENQYAIKIGDKLVWSPYKDDATMRNHWDILMLSSWGVYERNKQWARRINAVKSLYDIVVVYAGSGHLSAMYERDLPTLVQAPHAMQIELFPLEELPAEIATCYQNRDEFIRQQGSSTDDLLCQLGNEIGNLLSEETIGFNSITWEDFSAPLWSLVAESQMKGLLPPDIEKQLTKPFNPSTSLTVYLPPTASLAPNRK